MKTTQTTRTLAEIEAAQAEGRASTAAQNEAIFTLLRSPRIEPEYSDQWETTMVCDVRRSDGTEGDVWIVAGVPDYQRGSSEAARTQRGYETVRVFGDSADMWCPRSLMTEDMEGVIDGVVSAVETAALSAHREQMRLIAE